MQTGVLVRGRVARGLIFLIAAMLTAASGAHAQITPTVTIQSSVNPSALGESVTLTALVASGAGSSPTGSLAISDNFNGTVSQLGSGFLEYIGIGASVAAGRQHSCVVKNDATAWCWGDNDFGQLGNNSAEGRFSRPQAVSGLSGVDSIIAGEAHSCALTNGGAVWCWGSNVHGEIGHATGADENRAPVAVDGLGSGVLSIAAGRFHNCAVLTDRTIKCWGQNDHGQLGDGSKQNRAAPVAVPGLSGVQAVAAGLTHTCALINGGTVKCWGTYGVIGIDGDYHARIGVDGSTAPVLDVLAPTTVNGLSGVTSLSAGQGHACAVSNGSVKCWGVADFGELGNNDTTTDHHEAVSVDASLMNSVVTVAAGPTARRNCALSDGMVFCWGLNTFVNNNNGVQTTPVGIGLFSAANLSAGEFHICMIEDSTNRVACNGRGSWGQLGDGSDSLLTYNLTAPTGFGAQGSARAFAGIAVTTSALLGGTHSITASFTPSSPGYAPATSSPYTQEVTRFSSSVSLSASANPTGYSQSVTFTATVTPGDATGTVTFNDITDAGNPQQLGIVSLTAGSATLDTGVLNAGNRVISAVYNGDTTYYGSTSSDLPHTVNKASTTLGATGTPAMTRPGQAVLLQAAVAVTAPASGSPSGTVTFKRGTRTLGTAPLVAGNASVSSTALTIGVHIITAIYGGDGNFNGVSSTTTVDISPALGGESNANTESAGAQQFPAIARTKSGYVTVWASNGQDGDRYGVYGQRYTANGAKAGSEFRVNVATAGNQTMPKAAGLTGGAFVVTWQSDGQDGSGTGIYARSFSATAAGGQEFKVNTTTRNAQTQPAIAALADGGFVIAWTSNGQDRSGLGVYAQRFNSKARPVGAEFAVNTTFRDGQSAPAIAALDGGGFAIVWQSEDQDGSGLGIYGQRYDATGKAVGKEFLVNRTTVNDQSAPSAAGLDNGGFVVAWQSSLQDGSGLGVIVQRFTAGAARSGGEIRVNTMTANDQWQPSVSAFADGGFVVAWTSNLQDGSGQGVYAQAFNAAGAKADVEFLVNTTTLNNQWQPAVAATSAGNFMAAWTSRGQDGSLEGVFTQRLKVPVAD